MYDTFDKLTHTGGQVIDEEFKSTLITLVKSSAGYRTLWCEMEEVKSSGILDEIADKDKKCQEVMSDPLIIWGEYSHFSQMFP